MRTLRAAIAVTFVMASVMLITPRARADQNLTIANNFFNVSVGPKTGEDKPGMFTIRTGALHPAGPGKNILFGDGKPSTTSLTFHSDTSNTTYTTADVEGDNVVKLDAHVTSVVVDAGNLRATTTWSPPSVTVSQDAFERVVITQQVQVLGTTLEDSSVFVSTSIQNVSGGMGTIVGKLSALYDYRIHADDGPTFSTVDPAGESLQREANFAPVNFGSYRITDNDGSATAPTFSVAAFPSIGATGASRVQFVCWPYATQTPHNYAIDPERAISSAGPDCDPHVGDSGVVHEYPVSVALSATTTVAQTRIAHAGNEPSAATGNFNAMAPVRLLDTREGPVGPFQPNNARDVVVRGVHGVPATGVGAVALNLTVTEPTAPDGYLTAYPTPADGASPPVVSNLNFVAGQTVANLAVVRVGANDSVRLYNFAGNAHVIVDLVGWFSDAAGGDAGRYRALDPDRVLDTRPAGALAPGESRTIHVTGGHGVPAAGVSAVAVNLTATGPTTGGYFTAYPADAPRPTASNLNFTPNLTVANRALVRVSPSGDIKVFNESGNTHLIVDINGYFTDGSAPAGTTGLFAPLAPVRIADTRDGSGGVPVGRLGPGSILDLAIAASNGVPLNGATAVVLNVTVTAADAVSFLTAWPTGGLFPPVSDLNYVGGDTRPNLVVVKLGEHGQASFRNAFGNTHVIIDLVGWFS